MKWKFLETCCQRYHLISNEELEEVVMARGAKILLPDDPTNPEKRTVVHKIVWKPANGRTNLFRLTKPNGKAAKAHDKGEGEDEVEEAQGEAMDDSDNEIEMCKTSKEAIRSYRDEDFMFRHTETERCHGMCRTGPTLKRPWPMPSPCKSP